jgi:hypothetical protein
MSSGYAVANVPRIRGTNKIGRSRQKQFRQPTPMKLSIKQKIRNWLMNDDDEYSHAIAIDDSVPNFSSHGFRLNVYGASGGTIIETSKYDRKSDENRHSLHVVTEDKDLGTELSKIITMEQLR